MTWFLQNIDSISVVCAVFGAIWYLFCRACKWIQGVTLEGLLLAGMAAGNAPVAPALLICAFDPSLLASFKAGHFHLAIPAMAIAWFTYTALSPRQRVGLSIEGISKSGKGDDGKQ